MKMIRHFAPIALAVFFVIPSAGLFITSHTCHQSNRISIVFDPEYRCCHETTLDHDFECCKSLGPANLHHGIEDSENCCQNESRYIKQQEEYTTPGKIQVPGFKILVMIPLFPDFHQDLQPADLKPARSHSPPLCDTPSETLHLNASLLL